MKPLQQPQPLPKLHELGMDLLAISRLQQLIVLGRPFFFLGLFALISALANPFWALPALVALFVSNICAAHDVVHNSLRLGKASTHIFLSLFGSLVMQSGHSFRITHLSHHRLYPSATDPEGAASFKTFWQALAMGPLYVPRLWIWSWKRMKKHPGERIWMLYEALFATGLYVASILLIPYTLAPAVYIVVMTLGSWLYPIVTAWLPHDHHGEDAIHQSKSIQGKVLPKVLLGLTYHLEHHLYPRVPAHNMGKLSKRLQPHIAEHNPTILHVF